LSSSRPRRPTCATCNSSLGFVAAVSHATCLHSGNVADAGCRTQEFYARLVKILDDKELVVIFAVSRVTRAIALTARLTQPIDIYQSERRGHPRHIDLYAVRARCVPRRAAAEALLTSHARASAEERQKTSRLYLSSIADILAMSVVCIFSGSA